MPAFVDTSALLKLYVPEVGSGWMLNVVQPGGITISALAFAEMGTVLARRAAQQFITELNAREAWKKFRRDARTFDVVDLNERLLLQTGGLVSRTTIVLRTLDAIHLQSARRANSAEIGNGLPPLALISADERLLAAAQAFGFATDNPLLHP